jgi:hypothetical protein
VEQRTHLGCSCETGVAEARRVMVADLLYSSVASRASSNGSYRLHTDKTAVV